MFEFQLDKDHKITIEQHQNSYLVTMYEWYSTCGWRKLGLPKQWAKLTDIIAEYGLEETEND